MKPGLKFTYGDRVSSARGGVGSVVTVNHDDPDHVIFLVRYDEPVGTITRDDGTEIPERTVWVHDADLRLVQQNTDWAREQLAALAELEPTPDVLARMEKLRRDYDQWAGTDPGVEHRRARAAQLAQLD